MVVLIGLALEAKPIWSLIFNLSLPSIKIIITIGLWTPN